MREMRVMLVTLMARQYPRALASWERALRAAEQWQPAVRWDHLRMYGNPQLLDDGHNIVTHKYREAQAVFRGGNWYAMVTLEDDMVLPEDGLIRLMTRLFEGADISYGLYVWRHGAQRWSAYTKLTARSGKSLSEEPEAARATWGEVVDVAGVGLGCTAIKRDVLQTLDFRRGGPACNDWYLALDAQKQGYRQQCDLGLVCGHMTLEPSPRIYWPDPEHERLYRTEFLG